MNQLPDEVVLEGIIRTLIPPNAVKAIAQCARLGYGEARDVAGVLAQAKAHRADRRVVAAAFGFLPDYSRPARYLDVWVDDEFAIALLPKDAAVVAAFALSRAIHPEGCSLARE